ncbi:MAG: repressor LexA [Elusimicrobia bacterium CG1_02_63_36]|nr:MAG: repressor LexA [Elusimicrobia bacterium CG1_02_63_36]PJA15493.1 MAG: repressor LexA [Elusimicrobia bacterium CG_4_10_14_0_2_um_filter_63_34]PJB25190.1 MAG: repressor LexA [Elusimicrobia bacterium CG_4_9_14_3_um_filter_62_55]
MSSELTPLQKRVLDFITECIQDRGVPPTVREIGKRCKIGAPSSVAYHIKQLESKGFLKHEGSISRGLTLPEDADPSRLPVLGRVGAGNGIIAQEDIEGHLRVDPDSARRGDFVLRVRGDSMTGAGILEGDFIQVRPAETARDKQLVVAVTEDDAEGVVKRLRKRGASWQLESENPNYGPITERFRVVGLVVGLIRNYT